MVKAAIVILILFAWGCSDLSLDPHVSESEHPSEQAQLDAIFLAAIDNPPISAENGITVGILDHGKTLHSRLVSYENDYEWSIHRFEKQDGGWVRVELLSMGDVELGGRRGAIPGEYPEGPSFDHATGYSGIIAHIRDGFTIRDQWFVSNLGHTGQYYMTEGYGSVPINNALFIPGTQTHGDTILQVSLVRWDAHRDQSPFCDPFFWTSTQNSFWPGTCRIVPGGDLDHSLSPQRFSLVYRLDVTLPLSFIIHSFESNNSDYQGFRLQPLTFEAPISSVEWSASSNGVFWTPLAHSNCGPQWVGAFLSEPPSIFLRARVTLTNGRSGTATLQTSANLSDVFQMC